MVPGRTRHPTQRCGLGALAPSPDALAIAVRMCDKACRPRRVTEFIDHSTEFGRNFNHRTQLLTNRFKWKLNFLNAKQTGSRAVGGKRPHNEDLCVLRSRFV